MTSRFLYLYTHCYCINIQYMYAFPPWEPCTLHNNESGYSSTFLGSSEAFDTRFHARPSETGLETNDFLPYPYVGLCVLHRKVMEASHFNLFSVQVNLASRDLAISWKLWPVPLSWVTRLVTQPDSLAVWLRYELCDLGGHHSISRGGGAGVLLKYTILGWIHVKFLVLCKKCSL